MNNYNFRLESFLDDRRRRIDELLERNLLAITKKSPKKLSAAMRYVVLGGGKRLRALLVYAVGKAYGANLRALDAPALAIEMTHAFSLVHDDLPAMDNDTLRRGKPTCHIAFDESTAILVGDALVVGAFQILSEAKALSAEKKVMMSQVLAKASGPEGMIGGQYLDLHASNNKVTKSSLIHMYHLKTGELITAAIKLGAIAAGVTEKKELHRLEKIGLNIGLAFQIRDDILNIEGSVTSLGKNIGTDSALNKITYPVLVGQPEAKLEVVRLWRQAEKMLSQLKIKNNILSGLVKYIIQI